MPVDQRQVLGQVEEDPVHPARDEPVEAVQARLGGAQFGREQRPHDLDRQRGDVVVGGRRRGRRRSPTRSGRRAPVSPATASPSRTSTPRPRRYVTHGAIQASDVGASSTRSARSPARDEVGEQLHEDQPAGARAHLLRPRGDERARQPVGEVAAERLGAPLGLHVVPPALQVPLLDAPLVARREQREQPLQQPRDVDGRHAELRRGVEHELRQHAQVRRASRARAPARAARSRRRRGRAGSARRRPGGRARLPPPDGIRAIVSGRWR